MNYDPYEGEFAGEENEEDIDEFAEDFEEIEEEFNGFEEDEDDFEEDFFEDQDFFDKEFYDEFDEFAEASPFDDEAEDEFVGALAGMAAKALPRVASKVVPRVAKWGRQLFRTTAPGRRQVIRRAPRILSRATRTMARRQKTIAKKPSTASRILKKHTRPYFRRYYNQRRTPPYPRRSTGTSPPALSKYRPFYRNSPQIPQRPYSRRRPYQARQPYTGGMPYQGLGPYDSKPLYRRRRYPPSGGLQVPGRYYPRYARRQPSPYPGYEPRFGRRMICRWI